ncbi:pyruvate kinase [bacterium]|nr:pyruvate kinase [bacterium]
MSITIPYTINVENKKTKILATIGPATSDPEILRKLIEDGVNLCRLNLKHGEHSWHENIAHQVRSIAEDLGVHIPLIVDLQGPDIRTGEVSSPILKLVDGQNVFVETKLTDKPSIELKKEYIEGLKTGQIILIDDGRIKLRVIEKVNTTKLVCVVEEGGEIGSKKSVFFPGLNLNVPAVTKKDIDDVTFGKKINAEYVAISFVRTAKDIKDFKRELAKINYNPKIISKIETLKAVKNIDSIIKESDAIMVARGDLGVEIQVEAVPSVQKQLIKKCIMVGKPVIVATQMLKSMVNSPNPTRAEVSDVANAVFDKADAVMLSEESAIGKYPVKTVKVMAKTLRYSEINNENVDEENINRLDIDTQLKAIVKTAKHMQAFLKQAGEKVKYFVILTESGITAQYLSATRPNIPIIAYSQDLTATRQMSLLYGVTSVCIKFEPTVDESIACIIKNLLKEKVVKHGDKLIFISGQNIGKAGQTDSLRCLEA